MRTVLGRFFLPLAFATLAFAHSAGSVRGKLVQTEGKDPTVRVASGEVQIEADEDTWKVLRDERLKGSEIELEGREVAPGKFAVNGTHTHPVYVVKNGKRLYVTYWCDVCYIRTFVPGECWCCHKYTDLDLRESLDEQ